MPDTKLTEMLSLCTDVESHWDNWRLRGEDDMRMYLGKQWEGIDTSDMPEDYPMLTLNIVKKPVDTIMGYRRQNTTDIKIRPVEGGDTRVSEIHTMLIKHTMSRTGQIQKWHQACADQLISGLGWIHPYLSYDLDPEFGDIKLKKEHWTRIFPDPYLDEMDLSDAEFIFRRAYVDKRLLAKIWPSQQADILRLPGEQEEDRTTMPKRSYGRYDNMVNVVEKWYREVEKKSFVVNLETGDVKEIKPGDDPDAVVEGLNSQTEEPVYARRDIKTKRIKLMIGAKDLLIFDGENPHKVHSMFPFIPIFGHYQSSYTDWEYRLQGAVRKYRDIQLEKNKRRSASLYTVLTKNLEGYIALRDANLKVDTVGGARVVYVDRMDAIREIPQPEFPAAQVQLEQLFDADSMRIGENADLMGVQGEGSAMTAPVGTLQIRQRQALTGLQELFDNQTIAYKMLGTYHMELVNRNWERGKIERICGEEIPYIYAKEQVAKQMRQIIQMDQQMQDQNLAARQTEEMQNG